MVGRTAGRTAGRTGGKMGGTTVGTTGGKKDGGEDEMSGSFWFKTEDSYNGRTGSKSKPVP